MPELPQDAEHIRILVIIHYVYAGLVGLGILFVGAHFLIMRTVFSAVQAQELEKGNAAGPPMEFLAPIMFLVYGSIFAVLLAKMVLNLLSARAMSQRKSRVLSLVTAGVNCLNMPFGLVLGIFTFIVLCRDSVKRSYGG